MRDPYKSFDICDNDGPETILGVENGFVHSPSYPEYYGNNKNCYLNIGIPPKSRLTIYLINFNMEDISFFSRRPNDYLQIDNGSKIYGKKNPSILFNGSDKESVKLNFITDFATLQTLDKPKGFIIYFTCNFYYSIT